MNDESIPKIDVDELELYPKRTVLDPDTHRKWIQAKMGAWISGVILVSLVMAVFLIAYLAVVGRTTDYISSVAQSLQPFILPTLGALVGYSLRSFGDGESE